MMTDQIQLNTLLQHSFFFFFLFFFPDMTGTLSLLTFYFVTHYGTFF